jgi:hypothetical protein
VSDPGEVAQELAGETGDTAQGENGEWYVIGEGGDCEAVVDYWDGADG